MALETETRESVELVPVHSFPFVQEGDDVAALLMTTLEGEGIQLDDHDIIVIAQKVISKAEGRIVTLAEIEPSDKAREISRETGRDPRLVEVILGETESVLDIIPGTPEKPGVIVTRHRLGHVCTNGGVDKSNTGYSDTDHLVLLPENPDRTSSQIVQAIQKRTHTDISVMIIDSLGDPHRFGAIGKAIGVAGVPSRSLTTGLSDIEGKAAKADLAFADGIAAMSMLIMGQAGEGIPVVVVKGMEYEYSLDYAMSDVFIPGRD